MHVPGLILFPQGSSSLSVSPPSFPLSLPLYLFLPSPPFFLSLSPSLSPPLPDSLSCLSICLHLIVLSIPPLPQGSHRQRGMYFSEWSENYELYIPRIG